MANSLTQLMKGKHWIIFIIIIVSSYGIYSGIYSLTESTINENWQTRDRHLLIEKCMKDAGETATKYPRLTAEYCNCSISKIQETFSKTEYLNISGEPMEDQLKTLFPVISECQAELDQQLNLKKQE